MAFPTRPLFPSSEASTAPVASAASAADSPPDASALAASRAADRADGPVPEPARPRRTGGHSSRCAPPPHQEAPHPPGVPPFEPLKVRSSALRLQRALRRQRRFMAAGLAVTAAAVAASAAHGADDTGSETRAPGTPPPPVSSASAPPSASVRERRPTEQWVSAPVRIADAATVRLLRPGDRVDVIAAAESVTDDAPPAEIVASCVRVADVPEEGEGATEAGALVVLSVPRTTAAALAGAGATSRLAVTVC